MGTLLRSAEAVGVHGVIFPTRRQAPLSPAAVKASAGAVEHLLLVPVDDLAGALADLHVRGLRVAGADGDAPLSARQADLRGPLALVVGSEGQGIGPPVRRRIDFLVRIPMRGKVGSLNAAVAGSVLLFEVLAQRDPRARRARRRSHVPRRASTRLRPATRRPAPQAPSPRFRKPELRRDRRSAPSARRPRRPSRPRRPRRPRPPTRTRRRRTLPPSPRQRHRSTARSSASIRPCSHRSRERRGSREPPPPRHPRRSRRRPSRSLARRPYPARRSRRIPLPKRPEAQPRSCHAEGRARSEGAARGPGTANGQGVDREAGNGRRARGRRSAAGRTSFGTGRSAR